MHGNSCNEWEPCGDSNRGNDSTVRVLHPQNSEVLKSPAGHKYDKQGLVVIAKPENVKVIQKGNTVSSEVLTVVMDSKTGALTFSAKGKTLLREGDCYL